MGILDRVSHVDNVLVWALVDKTKLPFSTVRSLLVHGWSYQEELNAVSRWVPPLNQLKKDT